MDRVTEGNAGRDFLDGEAHREASSLFVHHRHAVSACHAGHRDGPEHAGGTGTTGEEKRNPHDFHARVATRGRYERRLHAPNKYLHFQQPQAIVATFG